jgi:hypothetical protein
MLFPAVFRFLVITEVVAASLLTLLYQKVCLISTGVQRLIEGRVVRGTVLLTTLPHKTEDGSQLNRPRDTVTFISLR